jgi:ureidoglycolate hydrolase
MEERKMERIKLVKLTPTEFKPYGYVISSTKGKPLAKNRELTYWSKVSLLKMGKTVSTGVLLAHKREAVVKSLERHEKTPEVLVALQGDSIVCLGKPGAGPRKIRGVKAFYVRQGQAICMHPGTWHCMPFPVNVRKCKFLVLFATDTEMSDLETRDISEEMKVADTFRA